MLLEAVGVNIIFGEKMNVPEFVQLASKRTEGVRPME